MGKDKASEKEIFELWWEYLKESKGYKEWLDTDAEEYRVHLSSPPSDPPIVWRCLNAKWETLFYIFGNIHAIPFEDWWKQLEDQRANNPWFKEIDDYSNLVEFDMRNCFLNVKDKATDQKALEDQLRQAFVDRVKSSGLLHLAVDVNADLEYLTKEFRRLISKHKKEKKEKLWPHRVHQYPSATRIKLKELKNYLSIYREDLQRKERSRKRNWKETIEAVFPKEYKIAIREANDIKREKKLGNLRSLFYHHLKMAKKLIENAESGYFPGDYK